jgi:hypothetical protein
MEAVESFMRRFAPEGCAFIIRPQWSYNYANEARFVENYAAWLQMMFWIPPDVREATLLEFVPHRIYWISFPRVERLHAILHAAWAHELGHTIATQWLEGSFSAFFSGIEKRVSEEVRHKAAIALSPQTDLFSAIQIEREVADASRAAMQITKHALTELIADAFALHVMGPAWFAAAAEIASRRELDANPLTANNYPPWRYRLRLMGNELKGTLDAMEARNNSALLPFAEWARATIAITASREDDEAMRDPRVRIPYEVIGEHWITIRDRALENTAQYDLGEKLSCIVELVARLEQQVPPNEHGTWPDTRPAAFEDILNAGWVQKYRIVTRAASVSDMDQALRTLDRLVLKGVESAELQRAFANGTPEVERT